MKSLHFIFKNQWSVIDVYWISRTIGTFGFITDFQGYIFFVICRKIKPDIL